MAKIYKLSDRKKIQIDDITISVAPLSLDNKSKAMAMLTEGQKTQNIVLLNEAIYYVVQCSLKSLEGVTDSNDEQYKLAFDTEGILTKECLQDLTNMDLTQKLLTVCGQLLTDYSKDNYDIDGVSVLKK